MKTIRLERRENNTYAFVEVINGDVKNAKEIALSQEQRNAIEEILNSELEEHDIVEVTTGNLLVKEGDKGTIVHVYEGGTAFEVEFADQNNLLLTMYKNELKKKL